MRIEPRSAQVRDPENGLVIQQGTHRMQASAVEALNLRELADLRFKSIQRFALILTRVDEHWHPVAERNIGEFRGRIIEERPAGEGQRAHEPVAEEIMDHRRASARRMEAHLFLGFENGNLRMSRKRRSCRESSNPAANDEDVRPVHASGGAEPLVHDLAPLGQPDGFDDLVIIGKD